MSHSLRFEFSNDVLKYWQALPPPTRASLSLSCRPLRQQVSTFAPQLSYLRSHDLRINPPVYRVQRLPVSNVHCFRVPQVRCPAHTTVLYTAPITLNVVVPVVVTPTGPVQAMVTALQVGMNQFALDVENKMLPSGVSAFTAGK